MCDDLCDCLQILLDNKVHFAVKRQTLEGAVLKLCGGLLSLWLPLLPLFFVLKRAMDSQGSKSKKQKSNNETPSTTFADVAGASVPEIRQPVLSCVPNLPEHVHV
jgi:ATP-dependent Zn protease